MAMGLLGYAVAGAGEGLGQGMVSVGFEAMKQAMEQNRQAALLQMREEMDIAKEKRGQDIKIADEKRHEETAKRLRETEGTPENIALQGSQIGLRKARDAEADAQFQRTGTAKFADGSQIVTMPDGSVERRDSAGNVLSSYKDKDAYARDQLGLIGKAGLAKTEADTELHMAQAGREKAHGKLLDRSPGRGTGGEKATIDDSKIRDRLSKEKFPYKDASGNTIENSTAQGKMQDIYDALTENGIAPEKARSLSLDVTRRAHERVQTELRNNPDADVSSLTIKAMDQILGEMKGKPSGNQAQSPTKESNTPKTGMINQATTETAVETDKDGKQLIGHLGMVKLRKQLEDAQTRLQHLQEIDARPQDIAMVEKEVKRISQQLAGSKSNIYVE